MHAAACLLVVDQLGGEGLQDWTSFSGAPPEYVKQRLYACYERAAGLRKHLPKPMRTQGAAESATASADAQAPAEEAARAAEAQGSAQAQAAAEAEATADEGRRRRREKAQAPRVGVLAAWVGHVS